MLRSHSDLSTVVIALFSYATDARYALDTLREHRFSAGEVAAAFREPPSAVAAREAPSAPVRTGSEWFGQLRQIYHGDDRSENAPQMRATEISPQAGLTDFESMLSRLDLSSRDTDMLGAIVTVRAGMRNPEAQSLLEERGAHIVHGRTAIAAASGPVVTSTPFSAPQHVDPNHIQLFGDVLRVRKEKVSSGEVQVHKEAVTHMETVQVPVTREHLVVEHTDGSGRTDAEPAIRIPLSEEQIHIDKDTVLREEYNVGKREVTQNESVSDTVRRERLLIDDARARDTD